MHRFRGLWLFNSWRPGTFKPVATLAAMLAVALFAPACIRAADLPLENIQLPPGFQIRLWARVPGARSLAVSPRGTVAVGTRDQSVYAVAHGQVLAIARDLNSPNGVAWRDGTLYVAEISRVLAYEQIEDRLQDPPQPKVIRDDFPTRSHHGWKFIRFGPDGRLYVPVGAPCNICDPAAPFATLLRMQPDGSNLETFARGIRNTVGFDWHPATGELWFTDNGRDHMGDHRPPDELNHAARPGMHFGFPYCHGRSIPDPQFGKQADCSQFTPPAWELAPHTAALGMRFYSGNLFPEPYRGGIFIAEHGSWNRSRKIGYRVMFLPFRAGRPADYQSFATGWLQGESAWGRPVDVAMLPDGSLLVSDDQAGALYQITYQP